MTTMSCSATSASVTPTLARANAAHPARVTIIARAANPAAPVPRHEQVEKGSAALRARRHAHVARHDRHRCACGSGLLLRVLACKLRKRGRAARPC